MNFADRLIAAALLAAGLYHCYRIFPVFWRMPQGAAYFFVAGIALVMVGALNLLRVQYGNPGTRWVSVGANAAMLLVAAPVAYQMGIENLRREPQMAAVAVLLLLATLFSLRGARGGMGRRGMRSMRA